MPWTHTVKGNASTEDAHFIYNKLPDLIKQVNQTNLSASEVREKINAALLSSRAKLEAYWHEMMGKDKLFIRSDSNIQLIKIERGYAIA